MNTTLERKFHIRWCCIDPLRPPELSGVSALEVPRTQLLDNHCLSAPDPISRSSLIQHRLEPKHGGALQRRWVEMKDYTPQQHPEYAAQPDCEVTWESRAALRAVHSLQNRKEATPAQVA